MIIKKKTHTKWGAKLLFNKFNKCSKRSVQ